jgi:Uma2 family endonuclease
MANATLARPRATLADLSREKGKAELIGGRIVRFMPTGDWPSLIAGEIFVSLRLYARKKKKGRAYPDGVGYGVAELPSGRESFSPDASFYVGKSKPKNMSFIEGVPVFAVEVRSENDYGTHAERELASKRADYFSAGTQVVWDVDPQAETVTIYRHDAPTSPQMCRRGDTADARPALPGWRMAVADIFDVT